MSGSPSSGFSSVALDRWAARAADRPPLTNDERHQIAGVQGGAIESSQVEGPDGELVDGPTEQEVLGVYAGIVDLVSLHVRASEDLRRTTGRLVGRPDLPVPFVVGVAGSVAAGKSTVARVLRTLIGRWSAAPRVEIVSTDSFLHPNAVLDPAGLSMQKGFPVSYDTRALVEFLVALRSGAPEVSVPVYSHVVYDVVPGEVQRVRRPDIVILEGVNVLQAAAMTDPLSPEALTPDQPGPAERPTSELVSDHVDLSIYVDAEEADIERWFVERFATLRQQDHEDERAFYRQFAGLSDEESDLVARWTWNEINLVNLREHIAPTRSRAQVVIEKAADHHVRRVLVRDT